MINAPSTIRDEAEDALAAWEAEAGPLTDRECTAFRIGYLTGCARECERNARLWAQDAADAIGRLTL